jgi:hypothetical protein
VRPPAGAGSYRSPSGQSIAYLADDERFGMPRMFDDHGFSLNLRELDHRRPEVTVQTHYTPRNPIDAAINTLMMKRQFGMVCDGIVSGLKSFVEARQGS